MTLPRLRLVGLYAVILFVVIGGLSLALAVGVRRSLVHAVDRELEGRARSVIALTEYEDRRWFVEHKSGLPSEYGHGSGRYYLIADARGRVVLSSAIARAMGLGLPAGDQSREIRVGGEPFREVSVRLSKLRDQEEGDPPIPVRVVLGKSLAQVEASMASLVTTLAVMAPLALLVSMAGGLYLVSRALGPIRASFERQTRFTADASHELRTPLAVIAGNIELAQKRPRTADEYRDMLADIGEASQRMRSTVESLLTLARADARTITLRREPVSLTALADESIRLLRPLAEKHSVKVSVESEGDVAVTGDRERLRELVSNLVANAIRYNRPGGTVVVRLAAEPGRASLGVDDTGIGIPTRHLPHIFERFYRIDEARSAEAGGSGLGLAIARWIAEAHAGSITVTSEPGVGSRFRVTLPA